MKVVKITAIWCSACLIMNSIWDDILKEKAIETKSLDLDYDEDEANSYNPGNILPVFIFYKDNSEVKRLIGEHKKEEIINIINEIGE